MPLGTLVELVGLLLDLTSLKLWHSFFERRIVQGASPRSIHSSAMDLQLIFMI